MNLQIPIIQINIATNLLSLTHFFFLKYFRVNCSPRDSLPLNTSLCIFKKGPFRYNCVIITPTKLMVIL